MQQIALDLGWVVIAERPEGYIVCAFFYLSESLCIDKPGEDHEIRVFVELGRLVARFLHGAIAFSHPKMRMKALRKVFYCRLKDHWLYVAMS